MENDANDSHQSQNLSDPAQMTNHKAFKRKRRNFMLLDFINSSQKKTPMAKSKKTSRNHCTLNSKRIRTKKKNLSRLRKRILLNRKLKCIQPDSIPINELVQKMTSIAIQDHPTNNIHSRRFRSYCDNTTSPELLQLTKELLRELYRFQNRAYEKNQIKARAHKRYVLGIKESMRQVAASKAKLVIVAPDCEPCSISDGLDDQIKNLKRNCVENNVQYLFALDRKKLGYALSKNTRISCVTILSYDGAQNIFQKLLECLETEKNRYKQLMQVMS